ncbi:MAG TPA: NAD(P)/FAD-dependent oxidoreductase [Usitatibacteraceae bacterium]|nr:NAD(P)/FAD-dependent oxidoreductase [Usitatibacteraceae bacterium]
MRFDAIVIGAGAAGMMCAARAGQRGRSVLLIDHYPKLGEKIRISGGGRCNFTNIHCRPEHFLSQNPHFCRSALARYTPRDFIALVERHRIAYHEKTLGQLFCDDSASQIIAMLKSECDRGRVQWCRPCKVDAVSRSTGGFLVETGNGAFESAALVIATGGLAVPKVGATPFGYQIAGQFGLQVVSPKPALVPLSFPPELLADFGDLAGLSLDAEVRCRDGRFRESLLLTHRGLSGPSILQISSYWQSGPAKDPIHINLLPDSAALGALRNKRSSRMQLSNLLAELLPQRFADTWCRVHGLSGTAAALGDGAFNAMVEALGNWAVRPSGTLGYNKAEVTLGGVDTRMLSSKTMEATKVPGLFFIGEVVDVTGHLGGFNFQWAWSSAVAAAEAV